MVLLLDLVRLRSPVKQGSVLESGHQPLLPVANALYPNVLSLLPRRIPSNPSPAVEEQPR